MAKSKDIHKTKMMKFRKRCIYFVNLVIAFSFGLGVYAFYLAGKPYIQVFYCDDESISKPYKDSTIPSLHGSLGYFGLTVICFCCVEFMKVHRKRQMCCGEKTELKKWFKNVVFLLLLSIYGAGITMFITDIAKYTIGRPRPHFFDVCKPDWSKLNCTDNFGRKNYIIGNKFCTETDESKLKAARLSFPSGHSSFSAFASTFLILYLESQIESGQWGSMPKLVIQVALGCAAWYIGLSRVSDNKHHPTDVIVGCIIGIFIGVVIFCAGVKDFFLPRCSRTGRSVIPQEERVANAEAPSFNTMAMM